LPSGIEVDFIVNEMELAIEAKASAKVTADQLRGYASWREITVESNSGSSSV
jgi:hypothetical protein